MGILVDTRTLRHGLPPSGWTLFGSTADWQGMPATHREQIRFLDMSSTRAVYQAFSRRDLLCGDDGFGNTPFRGGCFRSLAQHDAGAPDLKKWLYRRGVPFAAAVLLLPVFAPVDEPAVLSTWKMVVKYGPRLFSGDNLVVVGEAGDWCLYYHHDGLITFADGPTSPR
jgi:hypothetical protein